MNMMRHDELIFCLQKLHPGTVHGVDFWVAHPSDFSTGTQTGPAFIVQWNLEAVQPDDAEIDVVWREHGEEYRAMIADADARAKRARLLTDADRMVSKAVDLNEFDSEAQARAYRQALRDITTQPGWPTSISWPDPPTIGQPRKT
ncbi:TPA: hypothetical protein QDB14_002954 [Burkholderia vietnamiensis]|nr:hypothetical protein [Burkholderia vietnamiensis]